MKTIHFLCQWCGSKLAVAADRIGTRHSCDECNALIVVPGESDEPSSDEPSFHLYDDDEPVPMYEAEAEDVIRQAPQLRTDKSKDKNRGYKEELLDILRPLHKPGAKIRFRLYDTRGERVDHTEQGESVRVFRTILLICYHTRASDIHFEPKGPNHDVRIRVDGMMVPLTSLPNQLALRIIGITKVLCEWDISKKLMVQDGHFSAEISRRRIDYRASLTPSVHGQKLAVRILDLANTPKFISDLELPVWMLEQLRRVIRQQSGMILVCGPTGSGKTTSLYALLRAIDVKQQNVITIEDPVEYELDGVTQIPVNEEQGHSFGGMLKAVLRQDPDVLLLGEIRDAESAQIVMQSAITGHLVFSTVHSRDSIGTIFRLLDLGVEPFLVASSLNLILAQRLVRTLCDHCKIATKPKSHYLIRLGRFAENLGKVYNPVGCARCLGTGYRGRRAVFELLTTTEELRDAILKTPTMKQLRAAVEHTVFNGLNESGCRLVTEGVTSIDEIDRVIGSE